MCKWQCHRCHRWKGYLYVLMGLIPCFKYPASPGTPQIHMRTDPAQLDRNVYSYGVSVDGLDYTLVLQWTQYQILFYGKKLRKFSSGETVQRFQPCFAEQISSINTWTSVTAKRTFLNTHLLGVFPLQKRWNLLGSCLKTDVCFCQNTVERIRFGNARETKTCG